MNNQMHSDVPTLPSISFARMTWLEATKLITCHLGREADDLLDAGEAVAKGLKRNAFVYHARYAFGEPIIKSNSLCRPHADTEGNPLQGIDHGVPVGLVLNKQVEVYLPGKKNVGQSRCDNPTTLRLLGPGELFGTFETFERILDIAHVPAGTWEACAGARSALLVFPFNSEKPQIYEALEDRMKIRPRMLGGPLRLWLWHLMVGLASKSQWRGETIVFPQQWEGQFKSPVWRRYIARAAWLQMRENKEEEMKRETLLSSLADLRIQSDHDTDVLLEFLGEVKGNKGAAMRIMAFLNACACRHRVAFVPYYHQLHEDGGPFREIIRELCSTLGVEAIKRSASQGHPNFPTVIVPHYLREKEAGLIPVWRESGLEMSDKSDVDDKSKKKDKTDKNEVLRGLDRAIREASSKLQAIQPSIAWERLKFIVPPQAIGSGNVIRANEARREFPLISHEELNAIAGLGQEDPAIKKEFGFIASLWSGERIWDKCIKEWYDHPFFNGCAILKTS